MIHAKKRRALHKKVKGFEAGRKNLVKLAKVAAMKAGVHAYRDRKVKKRNNRGLWQVRINAAVRAVDMSYSKFIATAKKKGLVMDRKVLSQIAESYPTVFTEIINLVKA